MNDRCIVGIGILKTVTVISCF